MAGAGCAGANLAPAWGGLANAASMGSHSLLSRFERIAGECVVVDVAGELASDSWGEEDGGDPVVVALRNSGRGRLPNGIVAVAACPALPGSAWERRRLGSRAAAEMSGVETDRASGGRREEMNLVRKLPLGLSSSRRRAASGSGGGSTRDDTGSGGGMQRSPSRREQRKAS